MLHINQKFYNCNMNSLSKQKKELQKDKDKLIDHIEAKLAELRQQRKKLQDPQHHACLDSYQPQISTLPIQSFNTQKSVLHQLNSNDNIKIFPVLVNKSNADKSKKKDKQIFNPDQHLYLKHHQNQVKQKLNSLQELYNKKKQLQAIGIIPASINEVQTLYNDPKTKKKIADFDPKAKQKKDQILKQEMQRIGLMLKKKKITNKQIQQMKQHYYATLMKDKQVQLQRYEELLINNKNGLKLTLLQKDELIDIVFQTLKEFTGSIKKQLTKDFLLANQKFRQVFFITQEEIFNDLEVYQTQTQAQMTRNQFYQFIKSIEISNPMLNPAIRMQKIALSKPTPSISASRVSKSSTVKKKQQQQQKQIKSQMNVYLKKLFQYFDQSHEGVVDRERFVVALKRGLLLDGKKQPLIKKLYFQKFGEYLEKVRQGKNKKSYFMQLEGKFLAWTEIQQFYDKFMRGKGEVQNNSKDQHDSQSQSQQDNYSEFKQQKPTKQPIIIPQKIQKGRLEDYFSQYGWNESQPSIKDQSGLEELKKMDNYYKQLRQQYGNEIEWNNNIRDKLSLASNAEFSEDFKKLQLYIKSYDCKEK